MPVLDQAAYQQRRRVEGRGRGIPPPVRFIAVDGEGTEEEGGQVYSLLSSSLHNPISDRQGLGTEQCLRYLLDLKTATHTAIISFGFNYDVNMILRDIDAPRMTSLYEKEECWVNGELADYIVRKTKGKTFTITEYNRKMAYHEHQKKTRSVVVWDGYGFFQGSFLNALETWRIPLTEKQHTILRAGKGLRGGFLWKDIETITEYNHLECDLLVELMNKVQETLREQGLYLTRWDGAGAIAACLMKKNNVKKYVVQGFPKPIEEAQMRAYFGGRSQCIQFGHFKQPIYHYDINSAYPSSYPDLPDLHGVWREAYSYLPEEKYVLYELEWKLPDNELITPFPYRDKDGSIRYTHQGRGVYHSMLVDVAMRRWQKYIKIAKAYVFTPDTQDKPFGFVVAGMEERLRRKRMGDLSNITLKLGYNSIYGKMVQSIGFRDQVPPYQNYYWGGRVTAWSQARLLEASLEKPASIVFFGTDAIFSTEPLSVSIGTTLGTWEDCGIIDEFELYQPGLYRMRWKNADGSWQEGVRTRGFHNEEIDFDALASLWKTNRYGGERQLEVVRFQGLETCVAQGRFDDWRKWKTIKKSVSLRPQGTGDPIPRRHDRGAVFIWRDTYRYEYINGGTVLSAPYEKRKMIVPPDDGSIALDVYLANAEQIDNLTD